MSDQNPSPPRERDPVVSDLTGVHPTAVVHPTARVAPTAAVGPFAVIGPAVALGAGTVVEAHAVIEGDTTIGADNRIGHHAVIGAPPQIRCSSAPAGAVVIGDRNWIRELSTVHAGSDGGITRIGDENMLMAYSHVAHDCQLGSGVDLANGVQLAGHVEVHDHAGLGGLAAVHQFARIGRLAFVGAGAMVSQDVPPFSLASGDRARIFDLNRVGLKRHGVGPAERKQLQRALGLVLDTPKQRDGLRRAREELGAGPLVQQLLSFVDASTRGLCRRKGHAGGRR